ncbi:MAG: hypothetical protein ABIV13_03805 [Fimbriimonadales bacterium]
MITVIIALAIAQQSSFFARTFPNPTGRNGWEEYLMAADIGRAGNMGALLVGDSKISRLENDRKMVSSLSKAIEFVRVGNKKAATYPFLGGDDFMDPMVELSHIKLLGQVLSADVFANAADGKPTASSQSISDALILGRRVGEGQRISGLISVAMQGIALRALSLNLHRLDEKSLADLAEQFGRIAREPSPLVEGYFGDFKRWYEIVPHILRDPESVSFEEEVPEQILNLSATEIEAATQEALRSMAEIDKRAREMFQREERFWLEPNLEHENAATAFILSNLPTAMTSPIVRNKTQLRLAEMHCRVMLHKRQHNDFPASLSDLDGQVKNYDPTTGGPYFYERISDQSYVLYSLGTAETGRIDLIYFPDRYRQ